jgi:hypothetical protein
MSDPRNVAHAKKVSQEKKHHGAATGLEDAPTAQPGKKSAAAGKPNTAAAVEMAPPGTAAAERAPEPRDPVTLEGSLVVLTKLKELEFHSRAHLERLAELSMTVEDELKQTAMVGPIGEVYTAQSTLQTKLTTLIESYKDACDRLQSDTA